MSTCNHGFTAPDQILENLHDNQAGLQRHKCTECAFELGYQIGRKSSTLPEGNEECQVGKRAPHDAMNGLPDSQAGPGRHKCCVCAYHAGFERGRKQSTAH